MHDIKYFFSIKLIRQFRGQKKISGGQITKIQGQLLPGHAAKILIERLYCFHVIF
jgi:hypothetical protein